MAATLHRCLSVIDNSETGRSLMARSNHRIYKKELLENWIPEGQTMALLEKGSFVAMKQYCGTSDKKKMQVLCKKEHELLTKCKHENVVTVLGMLLEADSNNPESWPVIFMELGECSLQFALTAKRKSTNDFTYPSGQCGYSWRHCLSWLRQVASAMAYLHQENIVHRDLKSSNVLLFEGKTLCKICDFDMSRFYDPEGMTVDIGTWRWMAPEVRACNWLTTGTNQRQCYNFKADCYSFGILICECIYRQRPFDCYEDRLFQRLEMPDMPEWDAPTDGAMTLIRSEGNSWRVELKKELSHFPLTKRLWSLTKSLLSWSPETRPESDLIVAKLAIESPTCNPDVGEATTNVVELPQLMDLEAEADSLEPTPTDTGLPGNVICPAVPSVRSVVKLRYAITVSTDTNQNQLTNAEMQRILDVLKTHADNVASFLEDDEEETNNAAAPAASQQVTDSVGVVSVRVQSQFRFTNSGLLEHEISGSDADACQRVASTCNHKEQFLQWMSGLFNRERGQRRLRLVRFESVDSNPTSGLASFRA